MSSDLLVGDGYELETTFRGNDYLKLQFIVLKNSEICNVLTTGVRLEKSGESEDGIRSLTRVYLSPILSEFPRVDENSNRGLHPFKTVNWVHFSKATTNKQFSVAQLASASAISETELEFLPVWCGFIRVFNGGVTSERHDVRPVGLLIGG
ncbi:uncharacterized protein H6S33_003051 [Morchella sextelata]|uniref:uncharacterized protein n=1 Tax=Morchella sextelata TaxID=1174677 RepID=UPI001D05902F|nr:uncharacterized protein H6S33_003051 [Morchella sextelata]KAH0607063.1 hypothetical protein H6S33_003051 [Morchella sextelata]